MKKILLTLVLGLFVVFAFNSCEKPPPPKPDCEINNYGNVEILNSTGYDMWVDVTWGDIIENDERNVRKNYSTTYNKIPAGTIKIWGSFDRNNWTPKSVYLTSCENMTFTWNLSSQKSTETILELINNQTGEVVRTVTTINKNKN